MRRDPDLVRDVLLSVEACLENVVTSVTDDQDIINQHLHLMIDGGLINDWHIYALTWAGCELLETIRDDIRWREIKRILDDMNCYSFEVIETLAKRLME